MTYKCALVEVPFEKAVGLINYYLDNGGNYNNLAKYDIIN